MQKRHNRFLKKLKIKVIKKRKGKKKKGEKMKTSQNCKSPV